MRVVVLGGTMFIGRAITDALMADGHDVLVAHRGEHEPDDLAPVEHLHAARPRWRRGHFHAFAPDAAVDVSAANGPDALAALAAMPPGIRLIAISSGDVYRAYTSLHAGDVTDTVPLDERAPLRTTKFVDGPGYENLDVEAAYLAMDAVVLRLGAVYGEHDYQRRFEPILRRIRAGRDRIPMGGGTWLFSRVYAGDVARAVLAALNVEDWSAVAGECFNICESRTLTIRQFYEQIAA